MKRIFWGLCAILGCVLCANIVFAEDTNSNLLADIEKYRDSGEHPSRELGESIIERLEKNPAGITIALLGKLKAAGGDEKSLAIYIWAIGWTRDTNAADELIKTAKTNNSPLVTGNIYQSLAKIGGKKAGEYLLAKAKEAAGTDNSAAALIAPVKFDILNCLAEMQYEPALEEMGCLLKIAREASKPLSEQYWKEQDSMSKQAILSSLEKITCDLNEMESFFKQVVAKEQDKDVKKFAEETVGNISKYRAKINEEKAKKKDNSELYQKEYDRIFKDYGHISSIDTLAMYSSSKDEPGLKKLRERVLLRNSDECFYDYDKINSVIAFNRLIAGN